MPRIPNRTVKTNAFRYLKLGQKEQDEVVLTKPGKPKWLREIAPFDGDYTPLQDRQLLNMTNDLTPEQAAVFANTKYVDSSGNSDFVIGSDAFAGFNTNYRYNPVTVVDGGVRGAVMGPPPVVPGRFGARGPIPGVQPIAVNPIPPPYLGPYAPPVAPVPPVPQPPAVPVPAPVPPPQPRGPPPPQPPAQPVPAPVPPPRPRLPVPLPVPPPPVVQVQPDPVGVGSGGYFTMNAGPAGFLGPAGGVRVMDGNQRPANNTGPMTFLNDSTATQQQRSGLYGFSATQTTMGTGPRVLSQGDPITGRGGTVLSADLLQKRVPSKGPASFQHHLPVANAPLGITIHTPQKKNEASYNSAYQPNLMRSTPYASAFGNSSLNNLQSPVDFRRAPVGPEAYVRPEYGVPQPPVVPNDWVNALPLQPATLGLTGQNLQEIERSGQRPNYQDGKRGLSAYGTERYIDYQEFLNAVKTPLPPPDINEADTILLQELIRHNFHAESVEEITAKDGSSMPYQDRLIVFDNVQRMRYRPPVFKSPDVQMDEDYAMYENVQRWQDLPTKRVDGTYITGAERKLLFRDIIKYREKKGIIKSSQSPTDREVRIADGKEERRKANEAMQKEAKEQKLMSARNPPDIVMRSLDNPDAPLTEEENGIITRQALKMEARANARDKANGGKKRKERTFKDTDTGNWTVPKTHNNKPNEEGLLMDGMFSHLFTQLAGGQMWLRRSPTRKQIQDRLLDFLRVESFYHVEIRDIDWTEDKLTRMLNMLEVALRKRADSLNAISPNRIQKSKDELENDIWNIYISPGPNTPPSKMPEVTNYSKKKGKKT